MAPTTKRSGQKHNAIQSASTPTSLPLPLPPPSSTSISKPRTSISNPYALLNPSNLPFPLPPIQFTTIIEADHNTISHLATTLTTLTTTPTQPKISLSTLKTQLTNLLARLLRHDTSEELTMRPAFTIHLGTAGTSYATHDREDHARLKHELLALYQRIADDRFEIDVDEVLSETKRLASEMAQHMHDESGEGGWLERLEAVIGTEKGLELGGLYAATLVLSLDVSVADCDDYVSVSGKTEEARGRERWFEDVLAYANADVDVFRMLLGRLGDEAARKVDGEYLEWKIHEEMGRIGLVVCRETGLWEGNSHGKARVKL